jgi:hypothetical protein
MTSGPWPDDEPRGGASASAASQELEGFDDRADAPSSSRGAAAVIAGIVVGYTAVLAWLLVGAIYVFLTVYAVVKAIGSAPDEPNPTVVVIGIVGLVTALLLIMVAGIGFIGRSANPKKRRR